jgi:hypothetical protein
VYCRCPEKLKGQSNINIQGQYTNLGNAEKNDNRQNIKKYTNNAQTTWTPNGKGVNPGVQEK